MARNYIGEVDRINYTNTTGAAIASGAPVFPEGYAAGVALVAIGVGATGPVQTRGTVEWPKQPVLAIGQGARCFWDAANSRVTTSAGAYLGLAASDSASSSSVVVVALNEGNASSRFTDAQCDALESLVARYGIVSPITSSSRISIACIGDSISRNNYTQNDSGGAIGLQRTWTAFGAWLPLAAFQAGGFYVPDVYAVEGYSGKRTDEILNSLQSASATETWAVASTVAVGIQARPQQAVVVMAGTNDLTYYETAADANGVQKTVAGLRALWAYVRNTGARPIALSLLPRNSPASFQASVPVYNAAIRSAARAEGVPFVDAYTRCANVDGTWKTGYTYHNGSDDATGLHPSWLATQEIADELAGALSALVGSAPPLPRVAKGSPALYGVAFKDGAGDYWAQFLDGAFPNTTGVSVRYDPQGDASIALASTTIDVDGGGTVEFRKPNNAGARYADFTMTAKTVSAGQKYIMFADVEFLPTDGLVGLGVAVVDGTYQPIARLAIANREMPASASTAPGVIRVALPYTVPASITSVRPFVYVDRVAGGSGSGTDIVRIANLGHLRVA